MEKLIGHLGIAQLSKSQACEMAKSLDARVEAFRSRPLDTAPVGVQGRAIAVGNGRATSPGPG